MIEPIVIKVTDKVPELVSGPEYVVCDNSDYTVVWQLDEEWAQFEHRTMQVNYKDGTYERVLFTGDTCALPALPVPGPVHVGLFAGDIHTTRPARLLAVRSATTDSGEERDPTPDGYAQAIKALDGKLDKNQGAENAGKALVVGDDGGVVPGEAQGSSLPTMSSDTAGKMLTNDGEKAEWQAETYTSVYYWNHINSASGKHDNDLFEAYFKGSRGCIVTGDDRYSMVPASVVFGAVRYGRVDILIIGATGSIATASMDLSAGTISDPVLVSGVFYVDITLDSDGNPSANHTFSAIQDAYNDGRVVVARADIDGLTAIFPMNVYSDAAVMFLSISFADSSAFISGFAIGRNNTVRNARFPIVDSNAVHFNEEQSLTADQQAQARTNIGLTPVAKTDAMTQSVGYDAETGELWTVPAAGGGSDISLGVTGASVGDIVKVAAVDAEGKPTAWEAVTPETWNFVMADGTTVTKKVYVNADE